MRVSRRFLLAAPVLLGGCQYLPPEPDERGAPVGLMDGFSGRLAGSGVIRRKTSEVPQRFTLAQHGGRRGDHLAVSQHFAFAGGTRKRLTWRFEREAPGLWRGMREDLVEPARVVERGGMVWFSYLADFEHPAGPTRWGFEEVLYRNPDGALVLDGVMSEGSMPAVNLRIVLRA